MPIYDYLCDSCGHEFEAFGNHEDTHTKCPECGESSHRLCTCTGGHMSNEDAAWIRSVKEVVDKDGGAHCQAFLKDPTRSNYKNWMKGEGLRPLEPGEEKMKRVSEKERKATHKRLTEYAAKKLKERRSITVR